MSPVEGISFRMHGQFERLSIRSQRVQIATEHGSAEHILNRLV